jgi:hypothetical protein
MVGFALRYLNTLKQHLMIYILILHQYIN